ncbi:uncharacterized protein ASCRUDRAFT_77537, partial [Ascoidea rubescens DSM 1968]
MSEKLPEYQKVETSHPSEGIEMVPKSELKYVRIKYFVAGVGATFLFSILCSILTFYAVPQHRFNSLTSSQYHQIHSNVYSYDYDNELQTPNTDDAQADEMFKILSADNNDDSHSTKDEKHEKSKNYHKMMKHRFGRKGGKKYGVKGYKYHSKEEKKNHKKFKHQDCDGKKKFYQFKHKKIDSKHNENEKPEFKNLEFEKQEIEHHLQDEKHHQNENH